MAVAVALEVEANDEGNVFTVEEVAKAAQLLYQMDFGENASLADAGRVLAEEYMVAGYDFLKN